MKQKINQKRPYNCLNDNGSLYVSNFADAIINVDTMHLVDNDNDNDEHLTMTQNNNNGSEQHLQRPKKRRYQTTIVQSANNRRRSRQNFRRLTTTTKMSSSVGTSVVTLLNRTANSAPSYHQQQQHVSTVCQRSSKPVPASTIYSPQSSPNESSSPSTMLDDEEKPLDFSSKSSPKKFTNLVRTETELSRASKKIHPKFLAAKQHQAEHCFTTPSPSPPEHRISSSLNSTLSNKNSGSYPLMIGEQTSSINSQQQPVNHIFGKFFQEMNQPNMNGNPNINETLLNQALQLAKLTSIPSPMVVDSVPKDQQSTTAQLINFLSQVQNHPIQANMDLLKGSMKPAQHQPLMPIAISPMKPIQTINNSPRSMSPQFHVVGSGDQSNTTTNVHHNPFIPTLVNGGGLLTTASTNSSITTSESLINSLVDIGKNHNNRVTSNSATTTTTATTQKYTRPFKALYSNKDLSIFQSSPPSTISSTPSSSTPLQLESLTAQSLLNSDQAYRVFRSQMLSTKRSNSRSNRNRSSSTLLNGNISFKSENNSDDNSSNSSLNGITVDNSLANNMLETISTTTNPTISADNSSQQTITTSNGVDGPSPVTNSVGVRKRGRPLPDDLKDEAYWERRRKNNEAAKRSRDLRRAKEDEIAIRACFLEQENRQLKCELIQVKLELDKIKTLLSSFQQTTPSSTTAQRSMVEFSSEQS